MRIHATGYLLVTSAAALTLCGCGAGGESGTAFIPSPPATPTPTPTPTPTWVNATIFANPSPANYGTVGVAAPINGDRFGALSTADSDQVHILFNSQGYYEVQLPGSSSSDRLIEAKLPGQSGNVLQAATDTARNSTIVIAQARLQGYRYSELASLSDLTRGTDQFAFGLLTLPSQMPVSGTASYHGMVGGTTDIATFDAWGGYNVGVTGSVDLNVDFGKGSLGGSMDLSLADYTAIPLGSFAFTNTVFGAGSTSYSGQFQTTATGSNFFNGRFTGPNAEETIGAWALPFVFSTGSTSLAPDGQTHQAIGAWIAKRPGGRGAPPTRSARGRARGGRGPAGVRRRQGGRHVNHGPGHRGPAVSDRRLRPGQERPEHGRAGL